MLDDATWHGRIGCLFDLLLQWNVDVHIRRDGDDYCVFMHLDGQHITAQGPLQRALFLATQQLPPALRHIRWNAPLGKALLDALAVTGVVLMAQQHDEELGITEYTVAAGWGGKLAVVTGSDATLVLLTAAGIPPRKTCRTCLQDKPLTSFSYLTDAEDGRNRYCLACERDRVARYAEKQKDAAKQQVSVPAAPAHELPDSDQSCTSL